MSTTSCNTSSSVNSATGFFLPFPFLAIAFQVRFQGRQPGRHAARQGDMCNRTSAHILPTICPQLQLTPIDSSDVFAQVAPIQGL